MPKISIGDCSLNYEEQGSGEPLLLVPGLGGAYAGFAPIVPALSKHFRVIMHDHRGTGGSDKTLMTYSVDQMADDVIKLMDALKIDSAHYLGHSTGGAMGQTLAIKQPSRLKKLVLSATWTHNDAHFSRVFEARHALLKHLGPAAYTRGSSPGLWPGWWTSKNAAWLDDFEAKQIAAFPPAEIVLSRIEAIMRFDRRSELNKIKTPTLIIVADDDSLTPKYFSQALNQVIAGSKLVALPEGGHLLYQIVPEAYSEAVLEFLRG